MGGDRAQYSVSLPKIKIWLQQPKITQKHIPKLFLSCPTLVDFFTLSLRKKCPYSEFSGSYFPTFLSLRIQCKCGEIRTRKTPNTDTFQTVCSINFFRNCSSTSGSSIQLDQLLVFFSSFVPCRFYPIFFNVKCH